VSDPGWFVVRRRRASIPGEPFFFHQEAPHGTTARPHGPGPCPAQLQPGHSTQLPSLLPQVCGLLPALPCRPRRRRHPHFPPARHRGPTPLLRVLPPNLRRTQVPLHRHPQPPLAAPRRLTTSPSPESGSAPCPSFSMPTSSALSSRPSFAPASGCCSWPVTPPGCASTKPVTSRSPTSTPSACSFAFVIPRAGRSATRCCRPGYCTSCVRIGAKSGLHRGCSPVALRPRRSRPTSPARRSPRPAVTPV